MRDLVVITADADAAEIVKAVLGRPEALRIRRLDAEVRRHPGRDSGPFHAGPDLTRSLKSQFRHLVMLWDHYGSGREDREPDCAARVVQDRLDAISWRGRSAAIAVKPEIEEWLWHSPDALRKWLGHPSDGLRSAWIEEFARGHGKSAAAVQLEQPKELLLHVAAKRWERRPRPADYARIAGFASLKAWEDSESFRAFAGLLKSWFPSDGMMRPPAGGSEAGREAR